MTTCYIIDDDPAAIEVLSAYIAQLPALQLMGSHTDPFLALNEIRQGEKPDLLFISIELRQLSGIELAQLLDPSIHIVFTTANLNYKICMLPTDPTNLLLKPFSFEMFLRCIQVVFRKLAPQQSKAKISDLPCIFINSAVKGKLINIVLAELVFVQAMEHTVSIYLKDEKITSTLSIKQMGAKLPTQQFVRVHRTFIVNLLQIKTIENHQLLLKNGQHIPIGNTYRDALLQQIYLM